MRAVPQAEFVFFVLFLLWDHWFWRACEKERRWCKWTKAIHLHLPSILKWKTFPGLRLRTRPGHRTSCLPLVPWAAPSCCRLINPEGLSSRDGRPSRKWTDALKPPSKENIVFLHIQPRGGLLSPGAGRLGPQIVRRAFCFLSSRLSEMCRKTQLPDTDRWYAWGSRGIVMHLLN